MDVVFATGNPALRAMLGTQTMPLAKDDGCRDSASGPLNRTLYITFVSH